MKEKLSPEMQKAVSIAMCGVLAIMIADLRLARAAYLAKGHKLWAWLIRLQIEQLQRIGRKKYGMSED